MTKKFFDEKEFIGIDFTKTGWELGDYEACQFVDCNLSGLELTETRFIESTFTNCDFSNSKILETAFQDVCLVNCKLLGLLFEVCSSFSFSISFQGCQLDHSSFYQVDLTRSSFKECSLSGVDFTEANLSGIAITSCTLGQATFDRTRLEKANLMGSSDLQIDPEINDIRGAHLSLEALPGLLSKYGLHIERWSVLATQIIIVELLSISIDHAQIQLALLARPTYFE